MTIAKRCSCPWCHSDAEDGCESLMGQPTCWWHSGEAVTAVLKASLQGEAKCEKCGKRATRVTRGTGHACAVFFNRRPFVHCDACPWPDNFLYPRSHRLAEMGDIAAKELHRY